MRLAFYSMIFIYLYAYKFVWRQLGVAFFGATASAVALFDFRKEVKMEEKILIKSEFKSWLKNVLLFPPLILIPLSIILFIALGDDYRISMYSKSKYSGYYLAFKSFHDYQAVFLTMFILACVFAVAGIIMLIIYLAHSRCELMITESNVKGKALFGKQVVLPINMISAYSTRKLFSTVAISTSSGTAKFSLIKNYIEIGYVLNKIINEHQVNTFNENPSINSSTNLDNLVKLKSLLDLGVITQEEFDAKKKQLLGL